ncbi:MAG: hypothetical protein BJ554DRAFT_7647 [Olpidium bornovanus]|uniref:Ribonuclease PIN domain-containing protein n=1 Tax=Olpidium bornovanus TaxID=278681 RepID=A0A8H7ZW24_9FUNG|nr:MAG: hypothetical protein BJ554DRAFT_7647 [Olpidium bornovanus]
MPFLLASSSAKQAKRKKKMVHHQKQVERGGPGEGTAKVGGWSSASRAARDAVVGSTDRVGTLVLDAAPFLNGVKLDYLPADGFVTTPEVLKEIRDRQAREQLGRLTVDLKVRMPSADSLKAVAAFTAKTGDSAALSATDLRVIALAYTLEVEAKGCSCHLRTEPLRVNRKGTTEAAEAEDKENAGPDLPAGGDEERDSASDAAVAEGQRRLDVAPDLPVGGDEERKSANGAAEGEDRKHLDVASDLPVGGDEERKSANGAAEAEDRKRLDVVSDLPVGGDEGRENANGAAEAEGGNSLSAAMSLLRVAGGDEASRPTIRNTSGDEKGAEASQLGGEDGLDEDGWVTPDNIHVVRNKAFGVTAERRKPMEIPVACMSSDFAVQVRRTCAA